jgi:DNA repair exonuclease SbcCD ATPase subunit
MIFGLSSTSQTLSQAAPKTKTIKIKLPSGGTTSVKGTKQQIFKTLTKTEDKIDNLEEQLEELEQIEDCVSTECKNLEKQIKDAEKIREVIWKSLYTQPADASMLTPLTSAEFKYFANIVRKEIQQVEKDINEVELGKSKEVNEYLATFENSYLYKVGWGREFFIQAIKGSLGDDLKFFNKVLGGFEWLIANKNPDGITVINIGKRLSIQEKIIGQEENQLQNSNQKK